MIYNTTRALALGPTTLLLEPTVSGDAWTPADLFTGWSEDGVDISFPISGLADYGLTASAADSASGDARQVALSLSSRIFTWYNELTNKPGAMLCEMRRRAIPTAGSFIGKEPIEFKFTFYTEYPTGTITAEE